MNLTRHAEAPQYFPPEHFGMRCLRFQGHEAGPTTSLWMGLSEIEPGGHISASASPLEKLYLVVEGEVTLITSEGDTLMRPLDSARLAPGETRALQNRSSRPARVVITMPLAPPPVPATQV